jgi:UDP-glucose 4-epimerase
LNILITGHKGYIGSHLYNNLKKKNKFKIIGISSKENIKKYKSLLQKKFFPNLIIHCAGTGQVNFGHNNSRRHYLKNVKSTKLLIKFINDGCIKKSIIIFLSSQAVYKGNYNNLKLNENSKINPISDYGKTKLIAENLLKKVNGNTVVILRLFSVYGIGLKKQIIWDSFNKIYKKNFLFRGTGQEVRDFINIQDIIRLILLIIKKQKLAKYDVFNVGSGKGLKIKSVIKMIQSMSKNNDKLIFQSKNNRAESKNYICNISKVSKEFKWKPKKNFRKELSNYHKWFNTIK